MTIIDELVTILGLDMAPGVMPKIEKFNSMLNSVTKTVGWVSAGLVAGASSILYFAERMNRSSMEMEKFSRLTGMHTDTMQSMAFAAEMVGGSFEGMQNDLLNLTRSMSSPIPGEFNHGLFMMGVGVRKANGELKTADEVLLTIADRMQGMSKATQLQWASKIGISDDTLLLLQQGRGEIERLQQQARDIPTIVSPEQLKNAREFTIQLGMVRRILTYMGQEASAAAGPALKGMVNDFIQFLKQNREFIQSGIKQVVEGIVQGFERFTSIIRAVASAASTAFPWIKKIVGALTDTEVVGSLVFAALAGLAAVLVVLAAKFILIGAAIMAVALLFEDFITWMQGGESVFGDLVKWLKKLWAEFSEKFPGITALLTKMGEAWMKLAKIFSSTVVKAIKLLIVQVKDLFSVLNDVLHIIDKVLQFVGFGDDEDEDADESHASSPRAQAVRRAASYNVSLSGGGGSPQAPQPNVISITQNISGDNAPAVASEAAKKANFALQQTFPGGLAPVAN